jgi:hypothetical protein
LLAAQPKLVTPVLQVVHRVITRHLLGQAGRNVEGADEADSDMADNDGYSEEARTLRPLQAAACTYRIAFGLRVGQKVLTVQGAMPREKGFKQMLCADIDRFSLHAAVRCAADDRQALEQLCRYITRLALANERVQTNAAGQVVLKLKTPWRDGTTHLVMSPLAFMQRLAALVPRPKGLALGMSSLLVDVDAACLRLRRSLPAAGPHDRHPSPADMLLPSGLWSVKE